jgi:predicted amidophosphoribosyltransferase
MKEWLARYKYRGDEKLLNVFGAMIEHAFQLQLEGLESLTGQPGSTRFDCITYVPLSGQRLQERGFNQAQKLAEKIGAKHRIPVIPLLRRIRHTDKQSLKARRQRLEDLRDAFVVNDQPLRLLAPILSTRNPRILLIDDVYTTGSSLNECSLTICRRISAEIYGLTWAR